MEGSGSPKNLRILGIRNTGSNLFNVHTLDAFYYEDNERLKEILETLSSRTRSKFKQYQNLKVRRSSECGASVMPKSIPVPAVFWYHSHEDPIWPDGTFKVKTLYVSIVEQINKKDWHKATNPL